MSRILDLFRDALDRWSMRTMGRVAVPLEAAEGDGGPPSTVRSFQARTALDRPDWWSRPGEQETDAA